MSFFCLLWIPVFYFFWRAIKEEASSSGGVWALILGSVVSIVQFFLGDFIEPGAFGFSRWLSASVDIIALPAVLPVLVCLLFTVFKLAAGPFNFAGFTMIWLIPVAVMRAFAWSSGNDPIRLVLAPLLWTSIAIGVPFFIDIMLNNLHWQALVPLSFAVLAVPLIAAGSWTAFYSHNLLLGYILLFTAMIPLVISLVFSRTRGG